MGEVFKPDDLVRRVAALEQRLELAIAALWRKEAVATDLTHYSVTSLVYDDSGAPFSLSNVQPGPSGYFIIGLACTVTSFGPAWVQCSVSITGGPTVVAADDLRSIQFVDSAGGLASIAGYFPTPHLEPGVYSINWESKQLVSGLNSDIQARSILAISV